VSRTKAFKAVTEEKTPEVKKPTVVVFSEEKGRPFRGAGGNERQAGSYERT